MKKYVLLSALMVLLQAVRAQTFIPNQFMEGWQSQLLNEWQTNSCPPCMGPINQYIVVQDTDAYSGNYAANLVANGTGTAAYATTTFAIGQHPTALNAFVKVLFPPCVNDAGWSEVDTVYIDVEVIAGGTVVDAGHWMNAEPTDTFDYEQITIPISQNNSAFDSCRIIITGGKLFGGCGFVAAATQFKIDALAFTGANGCYHASLIPPVPCSCAPIVFPVCGCDGNTYDNPCVASCVFGISDATEDYCLSANPADPCNATVLGILVAGVEAGCTLVDIGNDLLLPCNAPAGFSSLPLGTMVLISWTPEPCISFCMQGTGANIDCYIVLESVDSLCMGDTIGIGHPPIPNELYQWVPVTGLSCGTCPSALASPITTTLYELQTSSTFCIGCPPQLSYYYVVVNDCGGCIDSSLMCPTCPCPLIWDPVCGCDGITYGNSCEATNAGVTFWTSGECGTVNCGAFNVSVGGNPPTSIVATNGSAYAVILSGGMAPFNYSWNTGSTNDSIEMLGDGTYCVTITDGMGCVDSACVTLLGDSLCVDTNLICPLCCDFVPIEFVCGCDSVTYNSGCEATYLGGATSYYLGPCVSTGIPDAGSSLWLNVYPVPVNEVLRLQLNSSNAESMQVQVTNGIGALLYEVELKPNTTTALIDVSRLPSGIYHLLLRSKHSAPLVRKFLKQ